MKKVLILGLAILAFSCSKSDDNNLKGDPIFDAEYKALKSLDELPIGTLKYAGNKVGNLPVGLLDLASNSCKNLDVLAIDNKKEVLVYSMFELKNQKDCGLAWEYPEEIIIQPLKTAGQMPSKVLIKYNRAPTKEELAANPDKKYYVETKIKYSGDLEIGFQAGYLRIEDKISNVSEGSMNTGKSYLYFHLK